MNSNFQTSNLQYSSQRIFVNSHFLSSIMVLVHEKLCYMTNSKKMLMYTRRCALKLKHSRNSYILKSISTILLGKVLDIYMSLVFGN